MEQQLKGAILVQCNPLLDISCDVEQPIMDKYGLKQGNAILADESHQSLFSELKSYKDVQYIAGGSGLNSCRVAQWMLTKVNNNATAFIGCVGKDESANKLKEMCDQVNVKTLFLVDDNTPTGECACLIQKSERSMVANLQAANNYKADHLQTIQDDINAAQIIYSTGFVLTACPASQLELAKRQSRENKIFSTNLSAPFICQFFDKQQMEVYPYCDLVFGNETEAIAFGEKQQCPDTTIPGIAKFMANLPKENAQRPRMVVITQGCLPTVVAVQGQDQVQEFAVQAIDSSLIVDTNGAGDAFVGGFVSQLLQNKSVEQCVRGGQYASSVIIQVSGTKLEKPAEF